MFCDVVHAKSTHFNISASVRADLPRGRVGGVESNLGWVLLLTEEDTFALGEAIAPHDQLQEFVGSWEGICHMLQLAEAYLDQISLSLLLLRKKKKSNLDTCISNLPHLSKVFSKSTIFVLGTEENNVSWRPLFQSTLSGKCWNVHQ